MAIRMYAASHDFPCDHAQELVVRLGMDEKMEECHRILCELIKASIRTALAFNGNFRSDRAFLNEMLGSVPGTALLGSSSNAFSKNPSTTPTYGTGNTWFSSSSLKFTEVSSNRLGNGVAVSFNCIRDVVTIVSREAMSKVARFAKEFEGKTFSSVQSFPEKISAICWVLETLLAAKVAEEFVQVFVHIHALPKILAIDCNPKNYSSNFRAGEFDVTPYEAWNAAVKLVLVMYQEVAAEIMLLKTGERVALLENWHSLLGKLLVETGCDFDQATKDLFKTLPFKQQMFLVKSRRDSTFEDYLSPNSLAKLVKENWPTTQEKVVASPSSISSEI